MNNTDLLMSKKMALTKGGGKTVFMEVNKK
jgi:hypothetical protein